MRKFRVGDRVITSTGKAATIKSLDSRCETAEFCETFDNSRFARCDTLTLLRPAFQRPPVVGDLYIGSGDGHARLLEKLIEGPGPLSFSVLCPAFVSTSSGFLEISVDAVTANIMNGHWILQVLGGGTETKRRSKVERTDIMFPDAPAPAFEVGGVVQWNGGESNTIESIDPDSGFLCYGYGGLNRPENLIKGIAKGHATYTPPKKLEPFTRTAKSPERLAGLRYPLHPLPSIQETLVAATRRATQGPRPEPVFVHPNAYHELALAGEVEPLPENERRALFDFLCALHAPPPVCVECGKSCSLMCTDSSAHPLPREQWPRYCVYCFHRVKQMSDESRTGIAALPDKPGPHEGACAWASETWEEL